MLCSWLLVMYLVNVDPLSRRSPAVPSGLSLALKEANFSTVSLPRENNRSAYLVYCKCGRCRLGLS